MSYWLRTALTKAMVSLPLKGPYSTSCPASESGSWLIRGMTEHRLLHVEGSTPCALASLMQSAILPGPAL